MMHTLQIERDMSALYVSSIAPETKVYGFIYQTNNIKNIKYSFFDELKLKAATICPQETHGCNLIEVTADNPSHVKYNSDQMTPFFTGISGVNLP